MVINLIPGMLKTEIADFVAKDARLTKKAAREAVDSVFEQVAKEGHAIVRSRLIGYNKQAVQPTSRVGPWPTLPQLVFRPMLLARQA